MSKNPNSKTKANQALGPIADGVMGIATLPEIEEVVEDIKPVKSVEKVALHSTKNVLWDDLGELKKGYNIVPPSAAERWLTRDHVRPATPEEVAKEYGL